MIVPFPTRNNRPEIAHDLVAQGRHARAIAVAYDDARREAATASEIQHLFSHAVAALREGAADKAAFDAAVKSFRP